MYLEAVPNISEGRDQNTVSKIVQQAAKIPFCEILHVDSGYDAHRTVITMVGEQQALEEAVFLLVGEAIKRIDMRAHNGTHPRLGAVDVCPFVPLQQGDMSAAISSARRTAQRIGTELNVPVYCYGEAAYRKAYRELATLRRGEYESLADPSLRYPPDFGQANFVPRSGTIAVGARPFLIAWNISLSTTDTTIAQRIAKQIRTSGNGKKRGIFPCLKAIGWYMEEYQHAQVSCNLTHFQTTNLPEVYEEVQRLASHEGIEVIGSELVGLIPKEALLSAGRYYTPETTNEENLILVAVNQLGLNKIKPFDPQKQVLVPR